MRPSLPVILVTTAALVLAGCADSGSPESAATSAAPVTSAPAETPEPTEEPSATVEPTEEPATEDPATVEPTTAAPTVTTDLPATVLLSQEALYPKDGPRTEREGVEAWGVPDGCEAVVPDSAVAMRTVLQGDGAYEDWVGYQQVAVFADVDAAVAEADRLGAVFAACADVGEYVSGYTSEPLDVGAQGVGLAVSYPGYEPGDTALGYFVSLTRRGNAVTLVTRAGGEADIATSREVVTGDLRAAWEQLCAYETDGC